MSKHDVCAECGHVHCYSEQTMAAVVREREALRASLAAAEAKLAEYEKAEKAAADLLAAHAARRAAEKEEGR